MNVYCSQCGVQLEGNSNFCFKCGSPVRKKHPLIPANPLTKSHNNVESHVKQMLDLGYDEELSRSNALNYYKQQENMGGKRKRNTSSKKNNSSKSELEFIILVIISLFLFSLLALYDTNIIGMSYIDWLGVDCNEWNDIFDDFDQDMEGLCTQRKGEGFIILFCLLVCICISTVSLGSFRQYKSPLTPSEKVHERHKNIRRINSDFNLRYSKEDIELYEKQLLKLGYDEDAARQYAIRFYQQDENIKNNLGPSLTSNRKEVKRPRPAKPSSPPPNRNNKQD